MTTIWKFPIAIVDYQEVMIPGKSTFLAAQLQGGQICLWAVVDPATTKIPLTIEIFFTGHQMDDHLRRHLGTVQLDHLVFHVFLRI